MKKLIAIVLIFVLCLSLCACGKSEAVKNVENLIANIGTVSVSSSDSIKKAEEAYIALSAEEQNKVGNYDVLENAKNEFEDLGIHLTIDNYSKYLDISFNPRVVDEEDYGIMMGIGKSIGTPVYLSFETNVSVSGKSDNYDYNDVIVTAKYTGYYVPYCASAIREINGTELEFEDYYLANMTPVDVTLTVNADIIGSGSDSKLISMPSGYWVHKEDIVIDWEIIDVSGIMTSVR